MTKEALKLALEALERIDLWLKARYSGIGLVGVELDAITAIKEALAQEKALQALHDENERLGLYKDAYAEPEEEKLHPVHIGVDVTKEGTAVTAFYRKPDDVMEMFYSQFHPLAQPEQEKERCVGCEACIDTACGRDECPKGWPKAVQPEQEPVAEYIGNNAEEPDLSKRIGLIKRFNFIPLRSKLYTTPPQRKPLNEVKLKNLWKRTIHSEDYSHPSFHAFSLGFRLAESTHDIKGEA